jgi:hypothetical protein
VVLLGFAPLAVDGDAAVGHDAIDVEQHQLDAARARDVVG